MTAAIRRALGQWFTAAPVARLAIAALAPFDGKLRVLDPTCGDGAFLAAARAAGLTRLTGVEIDRDAAATARGRVDTAEIIDGDLLAPGLVDSLGTFDLVVGNPPWVRAGRILPAVKRARAALLAHDWPELDAMVIDGIARHADVAATCLLRALRFVAPGGRLALVVSTALLDADGAAPLWHAVDRVAAVRAIVIAPAERWFADAAVNPMLVIAERRRDDAPSKPRLLRLTVPTETAAQVVGLDAIAALCDERPATGAWGPALRAPSAWFAWRDAAGDAVVPLRELAEVRRGITTGANRVFYLRRREAAQLRLEPAYLSPVVRSPFNGAPAPIAIAPDESPLVALALPPDLELRKTPRIAAWLARHRDAAERTSVRRRDPWWSLPLEPARLFLAKAYGPRFVQRLADVPMLADQRVYALVPREGVDLEAFAAVLNALPTALALESLGRGSMGYGAVEWTVADACELPVLDVRIADRAKRTSLAASLEAFARRPIEHVRLERSRPDRTALDENVMSLAPGSELAAEMWRALLASVALRDRYLLPAVAS
jgi:adenine-specific DNA-methyltransferase